MSDIATDSDDAPVPFELPDTFTPWLERWRTRCAEEDRNPAERKAEMLVTNPAYIPRNHQVEQAINDAYAGDLGNFHALYQRLQRPFVYEESDARFALPPQPHEIVQQTFCGT